MLLVESHSTCLCIVTLPASVLKAVFQVRLLPAFMVQQKLTDDLCAFVVKVKSQAT